MDIFENIYYDSALERFTEAKIFQKSTDIIEAIKIGSNGRRYIETLLNGKNNLPEWIRNCVDNKNEDTLFLEESLSAVLKEVKESKGPAVNETICLLIKKSENRETMENIVTNYMDTLIQYSHSAKKADIADVPSYTDFMNQPFDGTTWHNFEKEAQEIDIKNKLRRNKPLSKEDEEALYDKLYGDDNWELYIPKSFLGDSELASHIKPFIDNGVTYTKTRWCTAANKSYFNRYSSNGEYPLYVVKYFENGVYTEAWQIAFMKSSSHIEIMDKKDVRSYEFLIKNAPYELTSRIIDKHFEDERKDFFQDFIDSIQNNNKFEDNLDELYKIYVDENYLKRKQINQITGGVSKKFNLNRGYGEFLKEVTLEDAADFISKWGDLPVNKDVDISSAYKIYLARNKDYEMFKKIYSRVYFLVDTYKWCTSSVINNLHLRNAPYNINFEEINPYSFPNVLEILDIFEDYIKTYQGPTEENIEKYILLYNEDPEFMELYNQRSDPNSEFYDFWYYGFSKDAGFFYRSPGDEADNLRELAKCCKKYNYHKKGLAAIRRDMVSSNNWEDADSFIRYSIGRDKKEIPDLKLSGLRYSIEYIFNKVPYNTLIQMQEDIIQGLIPEYFSPLAYQEYGRDSILEYMSLAKRGAFDNTATFNDYITYGAQNLNDINVLKHQKKLWPSITADDCFQLGPEKSIEISREMFNYEIPLDEDVAIWDMIRYKDEPLFSHYNTTLKLLRGYNLEYMDKSEVTPFENFDNYVSSIASELMASYERYYGTQDINGYREEMGLRPLDSIEDLNEGNNRDESLQAIVMGVAEDLELQIRQYSGSTEDYFSKIRERLLSEEY